MGLAVGAACGGETVQVRSRNYSSFPPLAEKFTKKNRKKSHLSFSPASNGTISFQLSFGVKKETFFHCLPVNFAAEGQELLQPRGSKECWGWDVPGRFAPCSCSQQGPKAASGLHLCVLWPSKTAAGRGQNNKMLLFPRSSLQAFEAPLMTVGESLCFAIYHSGTQMKALAALLISSFPSEVTDFVLFVFILFFFAWVAPWSPEHGRSFSRAAFATEVTLGER